MKLLALLLLCPALALSQGLTTNAPGVTGGGKVLWAAPFTTPGCYASGQTAGASSAIAITRATTATVALTSDPSALTTCASGEFRVAYDGGLVIEPTRTNYSLQSSTMSTSTSATSPWALFEATVSTVAAAPLGGTWAELTSSTTKGCIYSTSTTASSATFVVSVWAVKASGTGGAIATVRCGGAPSACACVRSDGGSCTAVTPGVAGGATGDKDCDARVSDLGTTPVRITVVATCPGAITNPLAIFYPENNATGTTRFSGAQLEVGTYPTSLIVTTTSALPRNLDAVSATVPSVPAKGWCISGNWMPTSGTWPNALSLWTLGDTYNAANRASSWGNSSIYIVDAASGVKDLGDYTDPVAPWKIVTCNANGNLSLAVNGVLVDESATGAGTGILTTPATTLHFGAQASGGTIGPWAIKNVKVCSGGWKTCK